LTPADRILKHLNDNGIRQSHLAKQIGMKYTTLNAKLHKNIRLSSDDIEKICGALGLKPNDILKPRKGETA
jgi:DNA-binding Xre family transcriptional regulator